MHEYDLWMDGYGRLMKVNDTSRDRTLDVHDDYSCPSITFDDGQHLRPTVDPTVGDRSI